MQGILCNIDRLPHPGDYRAFKLEVVAPCRRLWRLKLTWACQLLLFNVVCTGDHGLQRPGRCRVLASKVEGSDPRGAEGAVDSCPPHFPPFIQRGRGLCVHSPLDEGWMYCQACQQHMPDIEGSWQGATQGCKTSKCYMAFWQTPIHPLSSLLHLHVHAKWPLMLAKCAFLEC